MENLEPASAALPETAIQTLDIRDFAQGDASARRRFVAALMQAYHEIGFVVIRGHSISGAEQEDVYEKIAAFFSLPLEKKRSFEVQGSGGARGYTSFGKEHAKDSNIGDLKEFFHVGAEIPAGHPLEHLYAKNVSVPDVPGFDDTLRRLYDSLLALGTDVLRAIALGLGLDEHFFDEKVRYGNSVLRPIHYPPLRGDEDPQAVRSGAHEDINLITLLIGASSPGLEVLSKQNQWIPITTAPSEIVVNVGDMLQRLTNHQLRSTTHRVVNPPRENSSGSTRFSVPFFLHPVSEMSLAALPSCVSAQNPPHDPPITAGEYLNERLKEIGLI